MDTDLAVLTDEQGRQAIIVQEGVVAKWIGVVCAGGKTHLWDHRQGSVWD